jgi:MoxR-like ATPase
MQQSMNDLVDRFKASFNTKSRSNYWRIAGDAFRLFWKDKIFNENITSFEGKELDDLDPIIRLLDSRGKRTYEYSDEEEKDELRQRLLNSGIQYGLKYEIEDRRNRLIITNAHGAANALIPQNKWYSIFYDLKAERELRDKLHEIFETSNDRVNLIDELKTINDKHDNFLTKPAANAVNCILCVYDFEHFVQVVSLNHRKQIIQHFELGDINEQESYGTQIIETNRLLLRFNDKYRSDLSALELSYFFYRDYVRNLWTKQVKPPTGEIYFIFRTGGGEYEDIPSKEYHFVEGIPGSRQVLKAENNGEFVYYELNKGGFWAKGRIGRIKRDKREGVTHFFLAVEDFQEMDIISFDSVSGQISIDSIGQAGMRKISKKDFDIIVKSQPQASPGYSIDDFMNETGFGREEIESWVRSLRRKKHIIFQGPPGTGKTYVAEKLARHFVSQTSGFWEVVQFHSAYNYEDFIQGLQPIPVESALRFDLVPGRFLQFCQRVRLESNHDPCVLIIDEINRANLARVFGELMYLLEYRDKAIPLAAGGEPFQIPRNVYLIGTMNTADRSIALVDHALRRRFSFIRLRPKYDILERELKSHNYPADELISVLKEINQAIDDPNYEVGISFFMKDKERLKEYLSMIWKSEIEPYLEEYFYDQPGKVSSFRWENLVKEKMSVWIE